MNLSDRLADLAQQGLEGGARELPTAIERGKAWARARGVPGVAAGLEQLAPLAPQLEGMARAELRSLFRAAFKAAESGDRDLSNLSYDQRRSAMRAETLDAMIEAERLEARTRALGDVLSTLGDLSLAVLPVLVAAL